MAKVSIYLKSLLIIFNVFFWVCGCIIFGLVLLATRFYPEVEKVDGKDVTRGSLLLLVVAAVTMGISFLGVFGAYKEKKWALLVFFIGTLIGFIIVLIGAVPLAVYKPQVLNNIEEVFSELPPLDEVDSEYQTTMEVFQREVHCCGMLNGYQDWGQKVPDSCRCPPFYQYKDCVSVPVSPKNKWGMMKYLDVSGSSVLVYKQPCGPIVLTYMRKVFDISLGITFGLAISAFIGMVMSMTMYCQIKRPSIIFSLEQSPPKYTELYSTAEY